MTMRRILWLGTGILVFAAGVQGAPEGEGGDEAGISLAARAVLDSAVRSMDPLEKLRHAEASRWQSVELRGPEGERTLTHVTTLLRLPDSLRIAMEPGSAGIDSGEPWSALGAPPAHVRAAAAKRLRERLFFMKLLLLRPLLEEPGLEVTLRERTELAPTLEARTAEGGEYALGFRREADGPRLVSVDGPLTLPDGSLGRFECRLSEFKEISRIRVPTRLVWTLRRGPGRREEVRETVKEVDWRPRVKRDAFAMPALDMEVGVPARAEIEARKGVLLAHEADAGRIQETIGDAIRQIRQWGLPMLGPVKVVFQKGIPAAGAGKIPAEVVVPLAEDWDGTPRPEGAEFTEGIHELAASITVRGEYGTVEVEALRKLRSWVREKDELVIGAVHVVYDHDPEVTEPEDQIARIWIPISRSR